MTPTVMLLVTIGVLFATGTYLLMERSLTRILLGFLLLGNGANLLILHMAGAGRAPILGEGGKPVENMADPLPQALVLTAIVITFAVTAFLLAMIYRSWRLAQDDEVVDDTEDLAVARGEATSGADVSEETAAATEQDTSEFAAASGARDPADDRTSGRDHTGGRHDDA